jgi:hypothetical protein
MAFLDETGLGILWQHITNLSNTRVPMGRTINGKSLNGDITLTASDLKTVILPEEKVVGDAATPVYINNRGEAVACSTLAAASAGKDGAGNIIADTYLKLSGGTVTGEVKSSAAVAPANAAFRNIKAVDSSVEIIAGVTAIPTGEIWVRYE